MNVVSSSRVDLRAIVPDFDAANGAVLAWAELDGAGRRPMNLRDRVASICALLPGAEASDAWGGRHEAWKVGDKMFACFGALTPGVSVKTPDVETAQMLIDVCVGAKAPYFHRSWILLPEGTPDDELAHRVRASYEIVRAGLPRKVQSALANRTEI